MEVPRIRLANLPTPLHRLDRLSERLGAEVWIKRDDLTGFGFGGNKVRKAEFLIADAIAKGKDVVITAGAVQSNHARAIAAAASAAGLTCHLVLSGPEPDRPTGNLLLDRLAGAHAHFVTTGADRGPEVARLESMLLGRGSSPYVIPIGGSNPIGARGYVEAFRELDDQLESLPHMPTSLTFATSSGGTYAGLLVGRACVSESGPDTELIGVRVDFDPEGVTDVVRVANDLASQLGLDVIVAESDLTLNTDHVGDGYGVASADGIEAIRLLWSLEGILLDPVYTAKAMAALIADARAGRLAGKRAVFLHTGGGPSVFADGAAL